MTNSKNHAELKAELKAKTNKLVSGDKELFANLSIEEIAKEKKEILKSIFLSDFRKKESPLIGEVIFEEKFEKKQDFDRYNFIVQIAKHNFDYFLHIKGKVYKEDPEIDLVLQTGQTADYPQSSTWEERVKPMLWDTIFNDLVLDTKNLKLKKNGLND